MAVVVEGHMNELPINIFANSKPVSMLNYQIVLFEGRSQNRSPTISVHVFKIPVNVILVVNMSTWQSTYNTVKPP